MARSGNRWIFGYGSLMWNPGFPFLRAETARLEGYHRQLCVYSFHYRGQPDQPGLVFGLDEGGHCRGLAFEVAAADWDGTIAYLRQREQITMVYAEMEMPVALEGSGEAVTAVTYVVDRNHPQCACGLDGEEILRLVRQGVGEAGLCEDYVRNTHGHLEKLGIAEPWLDGIVRRLAS